MADAKNSGDKKKVVRKPAGPKTIWVIFDGFDDNNKPVNPIVCRKADEVVDAVDSGKKYFKLTLPVATRAKAA